VYSGSGLLAGLNFQASLSELEFLIRLIGGKNREKGKSFLLALSIPSRFVYYI
jgi:hypothetical protein